MKPHDAVNEILPWYANGTASAKERGMVDEHLKTCSECRNELAFLQDVRVAAAEIADATPTVSESLGKTLAAIDEWETNKVPTGMKRLAAFFDALFNPQPGLARAALAVQFALILVLGGLLVFSRPQDTSFTTLSGGAASVGGGARLTLIFEPTATEAIMRMALLDLGGTVVSGPSALGVYVIELPSPPTDAAAVDAAIEKLRRNAAVVRFVERQP